MINLDGRATYVHFPTVSTFSEKLTGTIYERSYEGIASDCMNPQSSALPEKVNRKDDVAQNEFDVIA